MENIANTYSSKGIVKLADPGGNLVSMMMCVSRGEGQGSFLWF